MTDVTIEISHEAATELANALQATPPSAPKVYDEIVIEVVAGVITVRNSDGFANVMRVSPGVFDFTLEEDMPNLYYAPVCSGRVGTGIPYFRPEPPTSTKDFRVTCFNNSVTADPALFSVKMFR